MMDKCLEENTSSMTSWVTDSVTPWVQREVDDVLLLLQQSGDVSSGSKQWLRLSNKALSPLSSTRAYLIVARLLAQMDLAKLLIGAASHELGRDRSDGQQVVTWPEEPINKVLKAVTLHDCIRQCAVK
jgi:hypothetical protein